MLLLYLQRHVATLSLIDESFDCSRKHDSDYFHWYRSLLLPQPLEISSMATVAHASYS